jgi:hypothetical protein
MRYQGEKRVKGLTLRINPLTTRILHLLATHNGREFVQLN